MLKWNASLLVESTKRICKLDLLRGSAFGFEELRRANDYRNTTCATGGDVESIGVVEKVHAPRCLFG